MSSNERNFLSKEFIERQRKLAAQHDAQLVERMGPSGIPALVMDSDESQPPVGKTKPVVAAHKVMNTKEKPDKSKECMHPGCNRKIRATRSPVPIELRVFCRVHRLSVLRNASTPSVKPVRARAGGKLKQKRPATDDFEVDVARVSASLERANSVITKLGGIRRAEAIAAAMAGEND